jgi:hypothetical protein
MELQDVRQLMWNWGNEVGYKMKHVTPETKFITGVETYDAQLHHFKLASGIEVTLTPDFKGITGYDVLDEEKFTWFVLRYS